MINSELYQRGFVALHPNLSSAGYKLFIHTNALKFLNDAIQDDHTSFNLVKKIVEMRSIPRPLDGAVRKGTVDHRQIAIDGILVTYFIDNGTVCIEKIDVNPAAKARHEPAGLHHITRDLNTWRIERAYVHEVKTQYAAVNGQANTRERAALDVMPPILEHSYRGEEIKEFTLFHNPTVSVFSDTFESIRDKIGLTTPMTKRFAKLLQDTQSKAREVKWVAHSQGGAIFSEAVNYHNKTVRTPLSKHTVFFVGSANNMYVTKKILKTAGVKLHKEGYNNSPVDGVPQILGANAITDLIVDPGIKSLGRLLTAPLSLIPGLFPLSFLGASVSPHTRPYKGIKSYGKQLAGTAQDSVKNVIQRII